MRPEPVGHIAFNRAEVMDVSPSRRWHREGTPLCVAYHLFASLPDLQRVEVTKTFNRMGVIIKIHLARRSWLWLGWRHMRAKKIARFVTRQHAPAGCLVAIHLG